MANRRMISAGIFEDEFTGQLTLLERLLWIGLITSVADDQGRLFDSTALIRARIFLYDDVDDEQVEAALVKLASAEKIIRYKTEGKKLIQIVKWWIYQTPSWASPSKYPAPDNWTDRAKYHAPGNKVVTSNWDKDGGLHSQLHTHIDSPIEEGDVKGKGKGDVKGDVDVKGEQSDNDNPQPKELITTFCEHTKLKAGKDADETASYLSNAGVNNSDVINAIEFLKHSPQHKCVEFKSIKASAIIEMDKRKNNKDPEDYRRYLKGEYGQFGVH